MVAVCQPYNKRILYSIVLVSTSWFIQHLRAISVPAASSAVERVFSKGVRVILAPHRARMSDSLLSRVIFLKCNKSLLRNIHYKTLSIWITGFYAASVRICNSQVFLTVLVFIKSAINYNCYTLCRLLLIWTTGTGTGTCSLNT